MRSALESFGNDLEAHMSRRGYDLKDMSGTFRRLFVDCWAEPGFHRFWQVWNPVYGWGLLKLYILLGGNRRPLLSSLLVFLFCGFFLHDLIVIIVTSTFSCGTTIAFVLFAVAAHLSRRFADLLQQERWHVGTNVALNLTLVVAGIWAGRVLGDVLLAPIVFGSS